MKKSNPVTPILLRDAQGTLPKVYARFGRSPSVFYGVVYPGRIADYSWVCRVWEGEEPVAGG